MPDLWRLHLRAITDTSRQSLYLGKNFIEIPISINSTHWIGTSIPPRFMRQIIKLLKASKRKIGSSKKKNMRQI